MRNPKRRARKLPAAVHLRWKMPHFNIPIKKIKEQAGQLFQRVSNHIKTHKKASLLAASAFVLLITVTTLVLTAKPASAQTTPLIQAAASSIAQAKALSETASFAGQDEQSQDVPETVIEGGQYALVDNGQAEDEETQPMEEIKVEAEKVDSIARLNPGDNNEQVRRLQKRLIKLEYLDSDETTTFYGPATENAIQLFQRSHDLQIDGIAGEDTQKLLFSADAKPYVIKSGDRGTDVKAAQERLYELNYLKNKTTGYYGVETEQAVKAFQKRNNLQDDAKIGTLTRYLLYSPKAKEAPKPAPPSKPATTSKPGVKTTPKPATPAKNPDEKGVSAFLSFAKQQLGKKYVRSTEGPNTFDCSGFVYYCLRNSGVSTSRYSAAGFYEVSKWPKVSRGSLQKGDLLFFKSDSGSRISHTGIYLGGNEFIHAIPSEGKVVISTLSLPYWNRNYVGARRVY